MSEDAHEITTATMSDPKIFSLEKEDEDAVMKDINRLREKLDRVETYLRQGGVDAAQFELLKVSTTAWNIKERIARVRNWQFEKLP